MDGAADHGPIRSDAPLPKRVGQQGHVRSARSAIVQTYAPAEQRPDPAGLAIVGADGSSGQSLRLALLGDLEGSSPAQAGRGEGGSVLPVRGVLEQRRSERIETLAQSEAE